MFWSLLDLNFSLVTITPDYKEMCKLIRNTDQIWHPMYMNVETKTGIITISFYQTMTSDWSDKLVKPITMLIEPLIFELLIHCKLCPSRIQQKKKTQNTDIKQKAHVHYTPINTCNCPIFHKNLIKEMSEFSIASYTKRVFTRARLSATWGSLQLCRPQCPCLSDRLLSAIYAPLWNSYICTTRIKRCKACEISTLLDKDGHITDTHR